MTTRRKSAMSKSKRRRHSYARRKMTPAQYEDSIRRHEGLSLHLPVVAFADGEAIREAFSIWWSPWTSEFEALRNSDGKPKSQWEKIKGKNAVRLANQSKRVLPGYVARLNTIDPGGRTMHHFLRNKRDKKAYAKFERERKKEFRIKVLQPVRIRLSYPLRENRTKDVKLDLRFPGAIFGMAHDFYRELYAEDEACGGKAGPMNNGKGPLLNRGCGPLIWGHDIGDLVFESIHFRALDKKKDGVIGEFTFGIGS